MFTGDLMDLAEAGAFDADTARFEWADPTPGTAPTLPVAPAAPAPLPFVGGELPPLRPAVVAATALAMAEEYTDAAQAATAAGQDEAAADLKRAASAARKAAFQAEAGRWHWAGDVLLVQSATSDQAVYAVHRAGCHCKAAEASKPCWHGQLRAAYERAEDDLEAEILTTLAA